MSSSGASNDQRVPVDVEPIVTSDLADLLALLVAHGLVDGERAVELEKSGVPVDVAGGPFESLGVIEPGDPCLLYTSPSPRDATLSRMPSSA